MMGIGTRYLSELEARDMVLPVLGWGNRRSHLGMRWSANFGQVKEWDWARDWGLTMSAADFRILEAYAKYCLAKFLPNPVARHSDIDCWQCYLILIFRR